VGLMAGGWKNGPKHEAPGFPAGAPCALPLKQRTTELLRY
jgi:hypothetical protein